MAQLATQLSHDGSSELYEAVCQNEPLSISGLSERLFAYLFSGLVYAQIWEDPEVDMAAMKIEPGHRIVTIASGGCNILAYLTAAPGRIDAVDLNASHIALNRMKLAAMRHLPSHADVLRFFGQSATRHNSTAYDRFVAPHLDEATKRYWNARDWRGRRRISAFDRNFYATGLLGWCIASGHFLARLHGVDPSDIMAARTQREQRRFFDEKLAPLFDRPLIRQLTGNRASLFGLGIPPAQYDALAGGTDMASVLRARLEKLACHFPLKDNYFAWQAFGRRYPAQHEGALPLYLRAEHHEAIRDGSDRVTLHHRNFTRLLAEKSALSVDRFVLLDAQDWMNDEQLNALWTEITRTAAPQARVIFRTAGEPSILEGRVSPSLLAQWAYDGEASAQGTRNDRSAIYGGFHLYVKR